MVNQLLESFRQQITIEPLPLQKFDVLPMIDELILFFDDRAPPITLTARPEEFMIIGHPEKTQIILKNILENALKYSSDSPEPIRISFSEGSLTIQDHGIGISQDDLPKIWEPFFRTDQSRERKREALVWDSTSVNLSWRRRRVKSRSNLSLVRGPPCASPLQRHILPKTKVD